MILDFTTVFKHRHVVLPVIHVEDLDQAQRNIDVVRAAEADGCFLINHSIMDGKLLDIAEEVDSEGLWLGVNCLGMRPQTMFGAVHHCISGVWADNAHIDEDKEDQPHAEKVRVAQATFAPHCLYFGGIAFKYQREVENLEAACTAAKKYIDVVTTSGPGTGRAADVSKVRRMKTALGNTPLAVASGITPENVKDYMPYVDCFLVATGISREFTELDLEKTKRLVGTVRSESDCALRS